MRGKPRRVGIVSAAKFNDGAGRPACYCALRKSAGAENNSAGARRVFTPLKVTMFFQWRPSSSTVVTALKDGTPFGDRQTYILAASLSQAYDSFAGRTGKTE